jgi:hypothetical protein
MLSELEYRSTLVWWVFQEFLARMIVTYIWNVTVGEKYANLIFGWWQGVLLILCLQFIFQTEVVLSIIKLTRQVFEKMPDIYKNKTEE